MRVSKDSFTDFQENLKIITLVPLNTVCRKAKAKPGVLNLVLEFVQCGFPMSTLFCPCTGVNYYICICVHTVLELEFVGGKVVGLTVLSHV